MEIEVKGKTYRIGSLSAMKQFHVSRRLAPAIMALGLSAKEAQKALGLDAAPSNAKDAAREMTAAEEVAVFRVFQPIIDIIAKMDDAEAEYILTTCLSVVSLQVGTVSSPLMRDGTLMFQDLTMPEMIQLTAAVVRSNLGNFFDALPT